MTAYDVMTGQSLKSPIELGPSTLDKPNQGSVQRCPGPLPPTIKDSGARQQFAGGMVRDITEGKINYALVADGPMLQRWAQHLTTGAKKYAKRNWMLAQGQEEYDRAKESAFRHFMQWFNSETDEDHASAVFFNINEVEYLKGKGLK